ncbi:uncharacterized protein TNCV_4248331 [Trichonephila clavipes]|nr:uncharacterized protein TNCV_4248331 [Trichonephila clavipes]
MDGKSIGNFRAYLKYQKALQLSTGPVSTEDPPYTLVYIKSAEAQIPLVVGELSYTRAFGDGPVILNHGQVTWTTPELAPPSSNYQPHQWEDVSAVDRFSLHRCLTRRVFSGTRLELVTRPATIRYLDHSATAAPWDHLKSLIYETSVLTMEDIVTRIVIASADIATILDFFEGVWQYLICWCRLCYDLRGRNFE